MSNIIIIIIIIICPRYRVGGGRDNVFSPAVTTSTTVDNRQSHA